MRFALEDTAGRQIGTFAISRSGAVAYDDPVLVLLLGPTVDRIVRSGHAHALRAYFTGWSNGYLLTRALSS